MSNFKNELTNYQSIPRELIFDNTLSDRASFLYCYMASKPDGWDFYLVPMAKELGYSVGTLRKYISELVESGWLKKGEQETVDGKYRAVKYNLVWNKKKKYFTKKLYTDYLQTEYWRKVMENKIKQSGNKCQLCGSTKNLNVHHNSYEHIGNELNHLNDLVVLCKDCHKKFHDII